MDISGTKSFKGLTCERHEDCGYSTTGDIFNAIRERLSLGQNERIKSINNLDIDVNTKICLTELFGAKSGQSVVVIERQDTVDPENDLETDCGFSEYSVRFSYECTGDTFLSIIIHNVLHSPLKIKDIKYKGCCDCKIRSYDETGKFLTVKDGRLTMAPIANISDKAHVFTEYRYTGKEYRSDGKIKTVYPRTYKSNSDDKYISTTFLHRVKLEDCCKEDPPDSVFFKLVRSVGSGDFYYLEPILCPGTYLSFIDGKIGLKIFCSEDMIDVTENQTNVTLCL